ncbi:MAG: hypothetical protein ACOYN5_10085 [Bacteroidales bacterium]
MKRIIGIMIFLGLFVSGYSQERSQPEYRTVFGRDGQTSHGGYGALTFSYAQIDGKDAFMAGFKGGWLIDHHFTFGLAGTGFVNNLQYQNIIVDNTTVSLAGGYGGFLFEPVFAPFSPVHLAFPIIMGAGGIAYVEYDPNWNNYDYYNEPKVWDANAFFIFEPGVEIELNVARFMRIAIGTSYRLTSKLYLMNTDSYALNGFSGNLSLKFGKF